MSKRKRDISFIKPDEPAFIARMKAQIGYKEGPTVDTKREALPLDGEDSDDYDDEQPQVVVLKEGDLTAEEVEKAKEDLEKAPANLAERIVFRKPEKKKVKAGDNDAKTSNNVEVVTSTVTEKRLESIRSEPKHRKSRSSEKNKSKNLLSFNDEDE